MEAFLDVAILPQPDLITCGPTCLHAVYQYYGDDITLTKVIDEVKSLETGGTLDVFLACHALRRGYKARIYTYNLQVFDPTWFLHDPDYIEE
ncbi:MAG: C39 family peptidase, partial [Pseudomonadota bacterium]